MSGLAGLLAGHEPGGVWRWESVTDAEQVRRSVELAGWRFAHLDGWRTGPSRSEVLRALGEALDFPAYYGVNLDALADCLDDVAGPALVLWDGWGVLARADERSFAAVCRVLSDHAAETDAPFAVLLRGDGPATDLPELD